MGRALPKCLSWVLVGAPKGWSYGSYVRLGCNNRRTRRSTWRHSFSLSVPRAALQFLRTLPALLICVGATSANSQLQGETAGSKSASFEDWCKSELLTPQIPQSGNGPSDARLQHKLAVYYVVPENLTFSQVVFDRIVQSTLEIQSWYQCASGGVTWEIEFPEVVRVYDGLQARQFYEDNGSWWGSLLPEMSASGIPIWTPGVVNAIWAQGAGWWAGAAQFCGVDCGTALLGVEVFPEFNNANYSGGNCPGGGGVGAWPCTPEGAYAHELGHTLGLPHPRDVPATSNSAFHSIMQTHWNYPDFAPFSERPWGFLTLERQTILANPFMHTDVSVTNPLSDCDAVNQPASGNVPTSDFTVAVESLTVTITNFSVGNGLNYWVFGDGAISNESQPAHIYHKAGQYEIHLRVTDTTGMTALHNAVVTVPPSCCDLPGNANSDARVNIGDVAFVVDLLFKGGVDPHCQGEADANGDNTINIADVAYVVAFIFAGGPDPVCGTAGT